MRAECSSKRFWVVPWLWIWLCSLPLLAAREIIPFDYGWKHRTGLTDWAMPNDLPPVNTDPGVNPKEASPEYDDSGWWDVQLPHDGLIVNSPSKEACPDGCSGRSYIPRHVLWYRNTFSLPEEWLEDHQSSMEAGTGSLLSLEFEGSFRNTTVWLNGKLVLNHVCGYTPFRVELEPDLLHSGETQTLAVFVDPDNGDGGDASRGSGWWYEGGGLYRHAKLVKTNAVHVEPNGLFVKSEFISGVDNKGRTPAVALHMEASIVSNESSDICYAFEVKNPSGLEIASTKSTRLTFPVERKWSSSVIVEKRVEVQQPMLWSSAEPSLYQITIILAKCHEDSKELDRVSTRHGIRKIYFDADHGFFLNDEKFKIRGFCDHDTFAVVGMALPNRINLFRAQASRSIGGNGRRTSHNPPDPTLLDIYDRLGMVVMDENRLFDDNADYVKNMGDLVRRDRNHASVVIWSFCNEVGCEGTHEKGGPAFQEITTKYDGTRPTLANMFTFNDLLSNTVDVQGFSHQLRGKLDDCHAALPNKPIFMSECCSCNTMRGEDEGCETQNDNPHSECDQQAFNARCLDKLVNASDGVEYSAGTMVWTLFDYYGEPPSAGLTVSSTYGQYDLCGFPKSAAFWFRSQWLLGVADDRRDKPFRTHGAHEVHIVESWESPDNWNSTRGNKTKSIHAYANAPFIELFVNGKSQGPRQVTPMNMGNGGSYAEWENAPWESGTLTAVARAANGTGVAKISQQTNSKPVALVLSLDCPSETTGTGSALFLDGQDVALVRASIIDSMGQVSHLASNNITFKILSGPAHIQGTANGDPKSYQPHTSSSHTSYHGLVRAVVRVTSIAGLSSRQKELLGSVHSSSIFEKVSLTDQDDIVIEATSPGFEPVKLRIPTSTDASSASVLAVAEAGAGKAVDFFNGMSSSHDEITKIG